MSSTMIKLWAEAEAIDPTLRLRERDLPNLRKKIVKPIPYSRSQMFERMGRGQVSLFSNLGVPVMKAPSEDLRRALIEGIRKGLPKSRKARVQTGPSSRRCRMRVPEVIRRWQGGRAILSVTDLHFRNTRFDKVVDTSNLSDFNILCNDPEFASEFVQLIEMMTLVISSAGNLTDNHADDCDGTNHCFVGRKLWLAWDRIEGKAAGFQDVDRDEVFDQAAFDLQTFLSLPSSRWFTVEPDQTLFLPGSLAHKVITLEHYIGLGSFHVALPSYLRSLERWLIQDTHDIVPKDLLGKIHKAVLRKLRELRQNQQRMKAQWGFIETRQAVERWKNSKDHGSKAKLIKNPMFAEFVETVLQT
ncbi:MAG: Cupin-like domain [Blastocatellia bacterium]|jgi:hypothetical protein|nr:Cupin-like domain [Blastocatellia bacterium]